MGLLLTEKVIVLTNYANFADVFPKKSTKMLPIGTNINKHIIELVDGKQPFY